MKIIWPAAAITTALMSIALSLLNTAQAEGQRYIGGGFSRLSLSVAGTNDDASMSAVIGRLGAVFTDNFAAEIRAGIGVGEGSIAGFDIELDRLFGVYARSGVAVTRSFFPYIALGYTRAKVTTSATFTGSESDSGDDISFGLGADIKVGSTITFNIEYMNYYNDDGVEIDGFTLGIATRF